MRNVVYKARHWRKCAADLHTLASNKRYANVEDTILRIAEFTRRWLRPPRTRKTPSLPGQGARTRIVEARGDDGLAGVLIARSIALANTQHRLAPMYGCRAACNPESLSRRSQRRLTLLSRLFAF